MNYTAYCKQAGLSRIAGLTASVHYPKHGSQKQGNILSYVVPELTPDGTCNIAESLAPEPYDLRAILGIKSSESEAAVVTQLELLHTYLATIQKLVAADWIGIYQATQRADGTPVLVKLAYQGKPSRAEFPLTEDFAQLSNNSKVGLTGKAVVIKNVATHSGPYYTCDGNVQSELCLPVYNVAGDAVVGIIDLESFEPNHFDDNKVAAAAELCCILGEYLPLTNISN